MLEFWDTFFLFVKERKLAKTFLPQINCGVVNLTLTRRKRIIGGQIARKVKNSNIPPSPFPAPPLPPTKPYKYRLMCSFNNNLNFIIALLLKCTEITKSVTTLISYFTLAVAMHWMNINRSKINKVKHQATKYSITVQVCIENDPAKYLIL